MKVTFSTIVLLLLLFPIHLFGQSSFTIDASHWENCETGEGKCDTLIIKRKSINENIQLIMPCGGTYTTVKLYGDNKEMPLHSLSIGYEECPPTFNITKLIDGDYSIYMMACNLGGEIIFKLKTE